MKKSMLLRHSYSLKSIMRILCIIAVPVILLNVFISLYSLGNVQQQNMDSISDAIYLYQDETAAKIHSVEHFIHWSVVNEPLIESIEDSRNVGELVAPLTAFRTRVSDSQSIIGHEYQYFMYLSDEDMFFNASPIVSSYTDYLAIKKHILASAPGADTFTSDNAVWKSGKFGDNIYLYYLVNYHNRTLACFIDINNLIAPLAKMDFGYDSNTFITDIAHNEIYAAGNATLEECRKDTSFFKSFLAFTSEESSLPFNIYLHTSSFSHYGPLIVFQVLLIITALGLCVIFAAFLLYMYWRVINPIHTFSANLSSINNQDMLDQLQSSNIRELQQTSSQFRKLLEEISKLKINVYENELEKKRSQITFLQHQIRPHFYLNCLTTISSMAQLGKTKDIESMVLFTSRYLRYLFQADKDLVPIEYELKHIQAYLDIQTVRYGSIFSYDCTITEKDKQALLPPLLLITFVENSIKHSKPVSGKLRIELDVSSFSQEEKKYLEVNIRDSGQGFPDEVLEKIASGTALSTDSQSHIGITNSIQRLGLLYGGDYSIAFANHPEGGAHIRLVIPYQTQEESR